MLVLLIIPLCSRSTNDPGNQGLDTVAYLLENPLLKYLLRAQMDSHMMPITSSGQSGCGDACRFLNGSELDSCEYNLLCLVAVVDVYMIFMFLFTDL